ncbi:hypothetical protein [Leptospira andrefontaineae]|uniref:Uncharacterized protein n=1 Tax=Leptospira andrefontaineae TaxID=2484976 RepID=A0A4R9H051_9LEPT|nr:hypothetical protein [Leptospira andrefontaineae]TGK37653.1 hypothetical protein EHO65_14140 [Leptospira andrefontaineae]
MTHKIRIGGVSMGKDTKAPVFDEGYTNGYSKHVTLNGLKGNDFEKFSFGENGVPIGITAAMPPAEVQKRIKDLPVGSVVQIFTDTNGTPGPNHYCFIIKDMDEQWTYVNNNDAKLFGGSIGDAPGDVISWKKLRIFGLYYDKN